MKSSPLSVPLRGAVIAALLPLFTLGCQTGLYDDTDGGTNPLASDRGPGAAAEASDGDAAPAPEAREVLPPIADGQKYSMAFPTGDRSTSAVLLEKEMPAEVILGVPFEYRIEVQNLTELALEEVQVEDRIPAGLSVDSTQPPARVVGDKAVWDLGALPAGSTKTLTVKGVPSEIGALKTCATVQYESKLCASTNVVAPALEVLLTAPAEGLACDPLDVTVKVTNAGTGDARNVRVTEELPEGLTTLAGQRRILMDFGTLSSSQSKEQTVKLKAARGGAYTQTASAEANGGIEAAAAPITTLLREPKLEVALEADRSVVVTRPLNGAITVGNTGDAPSDDTEVRIALPSDVQVLEASDGGQTQGGSLVWSLGTLDPGASRALSFVLSSEKGQNLVLEAQAGSRCAAEVSASATSEIRGIPALLLEVADESDLILVGEPVVYNIQVTNQGSAKDEAIVIVCEVEEGIEIVEAGGPANGVVEGRTVRFEPVAELAPGEEIVYQVTVRSSKQFDSRFNVSLTSKQKTRPVTEEESTNFVN
ncbi:MAG: hypothetical protein AAFP22_03170 [Planctomycetota bacterium]